MAGEIAKVSERRLARIGLERLPTIIKNAGADGARRFLEFFAATIRNKNTRAAYLRAVLRFLDWLKERGVEHLNQVEPLIVSAYVEQLTSKYSKPTVKQHLAAIRMLFDWMITGGIIRFNPASSVRGPRHVVKRGKTPVLDDDQMQKLLDSFDTSTIVGLRDRALIGVMAFDFARISAILAMSVEDYFQDGKRWSFRLHEKGGKYHVIPAHHLAEEYMDAYVEAAAFGNESKAPLFRTTRGRSGVLTPRRLLRREALAMIKRRAKDAGLPASTCNHSFRATCITNYRNHGGSRAEAAKMACHESERTTRMYDRSDDSVTLEEIERINYR